MSEDNMTDGARAEAEARMQGDAAETVAEPTPETVTPEETPETTEESETAVAPTVGTEDGDDGAEVAA